MTAKEQAKLEIERLVQRFEEHKLDYRQTGYNETQTRRDFIDPFFKALGWDIDNSASDSEAYREVIHEDKVRVENKLKSPDYSFRLHGKRCFFVEAKKPSVNVKDDIDPAYQVKRYAWSAKLKLSIVTDFEEFAVYDCSGKPKPTDKASVARIDYFKHTDYIKKFDFIWDTFSKEAVQTGGYDKFVNNDKKKGTTSVDDDFLESLDLWRTALAKDIFKNNPKLTEELLNHVVQHTIDRIIFLRIAEDRNIEVYGSIRNCLREKGSAYKALFKLFLNAHDKYNSGLFDFEKDKISKKITISDNCLTEIIENLYFPISPYEFSVIPVEILGSAYEQFLGKTIKIKSGKINVTEKPEVRKAGGVYYTPQYIVDYIVQNTVGKLIEGKSPKEIEKIKVLDPASGSGSFLLGAYDFLLRYHLDWFTKNAVKSKGKKSDPLNPDGTLTTEIKKQILLNNIFGVDIDSNAVEVTKLSLLLKCLEGETQASIKSQLSLFNERVLPTLDQNIKCGNSLVSEDYFLHSTSLLNNKIINPFSWEMEFLSNFKSRKFDVIIGNPPYDVLEKDRLKKKTPHGLFIDYLNETKKMKPATGGKLNLYRFFLVKIFELLGENGKFGFIVPASILSDYSTSLTRKFLLSNSSNIKFDCFPQKDIPAKRVFYNAKLSTTIVVAKKQEAGAKSKKTIEVKTYPANSFADECKEIVMDLSELKSIDEKTLGIPMLDKHSWKLLLELNKSNLVKKLGQLETIVVRRGEINQTTYKKFIKKEPSGHVKLIKGVEVGRFRFNRFLSQGEFQWFDESNFLKAKKKYPFTDKKRIVTQRITGVDEKFRIIANMVESKSYFADSTNCLYLQDTCDFKIEYLLALLNSRILQWRFKLNSSNNNVGTNELKQLPIRLINFNLEHEVEIYSKIVVLVNKVVGIYNELSPYVKFRGENISLIENEKCKYSFQEIELLNKSAKYIEEQINSLVFDLYGLNEEDKLFINKDF